MTPIKLNSKYPLTAAFTTADGSPANVDGNPEWTVSDLTVASIEGTDDPFVVKLVTAQPGLVTVFAVADADLGEGIRKVTLEANFKVMPTEAETGSILVGAEENPEPVVTEQPAPAPEPVNEEPPAA